MERVTGITSRYVEIGNLAHFSCATPAWSGLWVTLPLKLVWKTSASVFGQGRELNISCQRSVPVPKSVCQSLVIAEKFRIVRMTPHLGLVLRPNPAAPNFLQVHRRRTVPSFSRPIREPWAPAYDAAACFERSRRNAGLAGSQLPVVRPVKLTVPVFADISPAVAEIPIMRA